MKKSIINIALIGTTLTALTLSIPADARKGGKGGKKAPEKLFARIDADSSETVTLEEMLANIDTRAQKKLDRADTDTSSEIELDEFLAKKRHQTDLSAYAEDIVQCVQDAKDESGDDNIEVPTADRFMAPEAKFASFDIDLSNGISLSEITTAMTDRRTNAFNNMDVDNSNDVTVEEFTSRFEIKKATRKALKTCIDELVDDSDPV
jgi:hypothetical protein